MKTIICLLTPFHAFQVSNLKKELELEEGCVTIYYSVHLSLDNLKSLFPTAHFISLPNERSLIRNVIKSPVVEIIRLRKVFKDYLKLINDELNAVESPFNLIVCSDKDLFCQLLINEAFRRANKRQIIAVDEGVGYYRLPAWYNNILNQIYLLTSKLLLNNRLRYIPIMGTHPYLDKVYLKFYKLGSPLRKKGKLNCVEIPAPGERIEPCSCSERILVLTAPLSEDQHLTEDNEQDLIHSVLSFLIPLNKPIDLKQHPREKSEKLKNFTFPIINILPKDQSAETLVLSNYKYIINFGSSVVLDLYLKEYPMQQVITIYPFKKRIRNKVWDIYTKSNLIDVKTQDVFAKLRQVIKY